MIFVKNSRGGREVNMINTVSKINSSKIGWEGGGVNLNLDNVCKYTVFFWRHPLPFDLKTNFCWSSPALLNIYVPSCPGQIFQTLWVGTYYRNNWKIAPIFYKGKHQLVLFWQIVSISWQTTRPLWVKLMGTMVWRFGQS